ncbi:MAG: LicD family protein [Ruminococcaceae bacterium]|nr:LicD family protein [Oscillospiraceae bacterium]
MDEIVVSPEQKKHQEALLLLLCEFDRVCKELDISYVLFAGTLLGAIRHNGFIPWDDDLDVIMLRADYERFLSRANDVLDPEKFFLQKEFSEHWPMFFSKLRLNNTTCLEKYHPKDRCSHQGIYMDIFPCDNAASSVIGRKIQFWASKVVIAKSLDKRGYATDSIIKKLFIGVCKCVPLSPFLAIVKNGNKDSLTVHSFLAAARNYEKNVYPRQFFNRRVLADFEDGKYPVSEQSDAFLRLLYGNYMELPPPEERICKQHAILVDTEKSYELYQDYRDGMTFDVYTRSVR